MIFITRIPTHYNDGSRVPKEVLQQITDEVFEFFGGCTMEGSETGIWADEEVKVRCKPEIFGEIFLAKGGECENHLFRVSRHGGASAEGTP